MKKLVCCFLVLMSILYAQDLKIQANYFEADEKKGYSYFEGNVHITKGYDEINASKVEIFIDKKRNPYKFIATGDVVFQIESKSHVKYKGKAQKMVYIPAKKEYRFYTDVYLTQLDTNKTLRANEVFLDAIEGKTYAVSSEKEPIDIHFTIDEKEEK